MPDSIPPRVPSKATLSKYGLTTEMWWAIFRRQGEKCPVCLIPSKTGRYVTDHEHVAGWKKLKPEYRRWFVRGILCTTCNLYVVGRWATLKKLRAAALYFERHELRKGMQ